MRRVFQARNMRSRVATELSVLIVEVIVGLFALSCVTVRASTSVWMGEEVRRLLATACTAAPTPAPTWAPSTGTPTASPTNSPTAKPSASPTSIPTFQPSRSPSPDTAACQEHRRCKKLGLQGQCCPTMIDTWLYCCDITEAPTLSPQTYSPTHQPSRAPTPKPTPGPTAAPSLSPTVSPTAVPTKHAMWYV